MKILQVITAFAVIISIAAQDAKIQEHNSSQEINSKMEATFKVDNLLIRGGFL